jgi:hypothetical protein
MSCIMYFYTFIQNFKSLRSSSKVFAMNKLKNPLFSCIVFLFSILMINQTVNAQSTHPKVADFRVTLQNVKMISDKCLQFDLYILDTDPAEPFELALFQGAVVVNPAFYEGGVVTASVVDGSSQLIDGQNPVRVQFVPESNIVKLPARMVKPLPKDSKTKIRGSIISLKSPGTRICSIQLTNTVAFTKAPANLKFSFTKIPYSTTVSQYLDGINTPIPCDDKNCVIKP